MVATRVLWFTALFGILIGIVGQAEPPKKFQSPQQLFAELAVLVTTGQAEEAKELALAHPVPPPRNKDQDEAHGTYLMHLGWIELTLGNHAQALKHLESSRTFWPESMWLPVYMLQACHGLERAECVWEEFAKIPDWYLAQQEGLVLLAAESARLSQRPERAWQVFARARAAAPGSKRIFSGQMSLLGRLGLGAQVKNDLQASFATDFQPQLQADDYGTLFAELVQQGYDDEVLELLELAMARFPNKAALHVLHGIIFDKQGDARRAAEALTRAASLDPSFAHDAALLLARAGELELALTYNSMVLDRTKKLEQRAILYLQQRDYNRLAALEKPLAAAGLLQRDDLRYALAFAHHQNGQLRQADSLLGGIADSKIFERATQLRADITRRCQQPTTVGCP
jgi:tetratricopeptide (TPR) repeat protein